VNVNESDQPPKASSGDDQEFQEQVEAKEKRKLKARQEERPKVWFGLGMFGLVGWSVAIPTLIGVALGLWLDATFPGPHSWTLTLLFVGIIIGCLNAWYWVQRESRRR
jgi:ATP synthase protein I